MLLTLAQNWWAIVLRGVSAVLFGLIALAWPGLTLALLILLYGAYALVDGILAVIGAIARRRPGAFPWSMLLAGLAGIAMGVMAFLWPAITAIALLYLIAAWAVIRGVFEVIAAVHLRREIEHEWLLAAGGVLSILLGLFLFASPGAGALALLWAIGAMAIAFGVLTIGLGFRLKGMRERLAHRAR